MKKADPTIDAVREARRLISESVGHDPRKLVEYYRQLQERHCERLIAQPSVGADFEFQDEPRPSGSAEEESPSLLDGRGL